MLWTSSPGAYYAVAAAQVEVAPDGGTAIRINGISLEVATIFFNEALSFVPCFKYADGADVIFFASRNLHYLVDQGGQVRVHKQRVQRLAPTAFPHHAVCLFFARSGSRSSAPTTTG